MTNCSPTPASCPRGRSPSTRGPPRSGRGWCRWAAGAAACTPTTGSRICSAWTCTARAGSCRSSRTSRSATSYRWVPAGRSCGSPSVDPERTLTVRFADGNWVWIFALVAKDGQTRLISRNRIAAPGAAARPPVQHAGHGTRQPDHGAQDAAGHQAARRGPGHFLNHTGSLVTFPGTFPGSHCVGKVTFNIRKGDFG